MNINLKRNIDRAINLMDAPADYEDYLSIKIKPVPRSCCCFHCWPETWNDINKYIVPFGPLEDEGDVLIDKENEKFVLECHESGPEIILYLALGTASITLVRSIIELITTLVKALEKERRKTPGKLEIIKRRQIRGEIEEEEIMKVDFPLSDDTIERLNENIRNAIKPRKE